ncbi:MAG: LysR family transcriptional regulator [Gammaproteobacteria bacterium]
MRNLDIGALRSLVAIADTRTVTKAAQQNHLTQSAVSMQIKRLERTFDTKLLHREGRGVVLTATGQQLVSYARRLIELNDETWSRLTNDDYEGEITLGVPIDLIYPHVPMILQRAKERYPRIKISLVSSLTRLLLEQLNKGEVDLTLTTEKRLHRGGRTLAKVKQVWMGAEGGQAYLKRPIPLAMCNVCSQRQDAIDSLDQAGIPWEIVTDTNSEPTVHAMVAADLAITPQVETSMEPGCIVVPEGLPTLSDIYINLYTASASDSRLVEKIAELTEEVYAQDERCLAPPVTDETLRETG